MKTGMKSVTIISLIAVVVVGALMWDYLPFTAGVGEKAPEINSFEECAEAGYPIMPARTTGIVQSGGESYPERCATPDGRTFTREVEEPVTPPVVFPPANPGNGGGPGSGNNPGEGDDMVACTMDAMQCPDGSWVGRSGPNCQFVCPGQ